MAERSRVWEPRLTAMSALLVAIVLIRFLGAPPVYVLTGCGLAVLISVVRARQGAEQRRTLR